MLLLGLDTATRRVGVVLADENGMLARVEVGGLGEHADPRHAETLAPAIAWCCEQCDVSVQQLSVVAVGTGPGMFTGLRVGVTTAKVLAQSLRIPVIPVSSLDLLAYPLQYSNRLIVAVMDARRGEVFHASYRRVPGGLQRVTDYGVSAPRRVAADLEAQVEEAILVGDGA
ncbi:MAG TPA: tRNA (adenosine(37)-N6)-threonylcarbamoyltransferase complex dimerization subunit type 1 TsaB, partial [Acidimicrobiia bacterium]|nr:tRNA (adenosine(37)-N6)-threonylcarbamoyltransferase complex dimerization subunit type 1 TsaB [Acidimicrobiia bacterium]